jgi:hypothetical protein
LNPVVQDLELQYAAARDAIAAVVAGQSEEDLQWHEAEGRWSIVECLEHLNSAWTVLPKLDRKIAEARERGVLGSPPFAEPWLGRLYIRAIEPPVRLKVPAPKRYRPRPRLPSSEVVPRVLQLQDELAARVRASDGLDLGAIRMSSPISRRFKMTLGQWLAFLPAHERRHLWQAKRVRDARASSHSQGTIS